MESYSGCWDACLEDTDCLAADVDAQNSLCRLFYVLEKEVKFEQLIGSRVAYKQCPGNLRHFIPLALVRASVYIFMIVIVQSNPGMQL